MDFDRIGFDQEVGAFVREARKDRGLTQEQLAAAIGITRATLASIEAGRQRIPLDVIWRVGVELGLSVASLVPQPETRPTRPSRPSGVEDRQRLTGSAVLIPYQRTGR